MIHSNIVASARTRSRWWMQLLSSVRIDAAVLHGVCCSAFMQKNSRASDVVDAATQLSVGCNNKSDSRHS